MRVDTLTNTQFMPIVFSIKNQLDTFMSILHRITDMINLINY